jgi:E2/UBC family protein E
MIGDQFLELQKYLQDEKKQDAAIQRRADGSYLVTIAGVQLPAGWTPCEKVEVLFIAPPGYPGAKPDCFWVSPPVRLANGAMPQAANDGNPLPYDHIAGRRLTWFSWHLQTWDPNHSTLASFYKVIQQRLNPAR